MGKSNLVVIIIGPRHIPFTKGVPISLKQMIFAVHDYNFIKMLIIDLAQMI